MNPDTARRLDYYVGIPLCFLGTLTHKLTGLIGPSKPTAKPANILFIELSEMGSAILADPAMQKLKSRLNANLFFVIFRSNRPGLDIMNTVLPDNIFVIDDSGVTSVAAGAIKLLAWMRRKNIDTVIDLELFSRFTALLSGFSGASFRIGFYAFYTEGLYRGDFLTHKVAYNPHQHIAKNFMALANALLSDKTEVPYSKSRIDDNEILPRKIFASEESVTLVYKRICSLFPAFDVSKNRLVLFNTNASDLIPLRRWPRENFITLAGLVLEKYPDVIIMLTGTQAEHREIDSLANAVQNRRCINFAGQTDAGELTALYSLSKFMLTNDSGPAHFASVTHMPVYVLFGPETPKLYGPLGAMTPIYSGLACSPCVSAANHRKSPCNDNVCLQVITPQNVFSVLIPLLETP